jgi:hypothetical protein
LHVHDGHNYNMQFPPHVANSPDHVTKVRGKELGCGQRQLTTCQIRLSQVWPSEVPDVLVCLCAALGQYCTVRLTHRGHSWHNWT